MPVIALIAAVLGVPFAAIWQTLRVANQLRLQIKGWVTFFVILPFFIYLAGHIFIAAHYHEWLSVRAAEWTMTFITLYGAALWFQGGITVDAILAAGLFRSTQPRQVLAYQGPMPRAYALGFFLGANSRALGEGLFQFLRKMFVVYYLIGLGFYLIPFFNNWGLVMGAEIAFLLYLICADTEFPWKRFAIIGRVTAFLLIVGTIANTPITALRDYYSPMMANSAARATSNSYFQTKGGTSLKHCLGCVQNGKFVNNPSKWAFSQPLDKAANQSVWVLPVNESSPTPIKMGGIQYLPVYEAYSNNPRYEFNRNEVYFAIWDDLDRKVSLSGKSSDEITQWLWETPWLLFSVLGAFLCLWILKHIIKSSQQTATAPVRALAHAPAGGH